MHLVITLLVITLLATPLVFSSTSLHPVSSTHAEIPQIREAEAPVTESEQRSHPEEETPDQPPPQKPAVQTTLTPKPASKPTPAKTLNPAALLEEKILAFTNTERARRNLGGLAANAALAATARAHSADMLARDFFDHENPDSCSSSCRATNAGYAWRMVGENIYMLEGFDFSSDETAAMIVSGWMESPGHRANILRDGYTETGVGVVVRGRTIYATALYATPR